MKGVKLEKKKYSIIFYKDKRGRQPIVEYIRELDNTKTKDARIKLKKIRTCIELLEKHGTSVGEPYMKHLAGEIWELRPLKDRILFAAYNEGSFVLLHHFRKETQKNAYKRNITS